MAIVMGGPPTAALLCRSSAFFPPELLHALSASSPATTVAITRRFIARLLSKAPMPGGVRLSAHRGSGHGPIRRPRRDGGLAGRTEGSVGQRDRSGRGIR